LVPGGWDSRANFGKVLSLGSGLANSESGRERLRLRGARRLWVLGAEGGRETDREGQRGTERDREGEGEGGEWCGVRGVGLVPDGCVDVRGGV